MLHFEMSPDPEDIAVKSRAFSEPLGTSILVVGDFTGIENNLPILDRVPESVKRDDVDRHCARRKFTTSITKSVRQLVEHAPSGVLIELLHASKDDLICDFEDSPTLRKSGFFILANPRNHQGMRPYSLAVILDSASGYFLQQVALVARAKNMPILIEGEAMMDPAKPEARFVVPCPEGAMAAAEQVLSSFRGNAPVPNLSTCGGTSLSSALWITRFAQQMLHIDYHHGCPSRDRDALAMTEIMNRALATRLQSRSDISVRVSDFQWLTRPVAEMTLAVTTPEISVQDKIQLQFEYG